MKLTEAGGRESTVFLISSKSVITMFKRLINNFDLDYVDELEEKSCLIPSNNAIMFCYFNNLQYFHKYLENYKGDSNQVHI